MDIDLDTNLVLDLIYLDGKKEEKIPKYSQASVKLFDYIKKENKGKHNFNMQLDSFQELPTTISKKYVLEDLYSKGISLTYYLREWRQRRAGFIKEVKDVINDFYKEYIDKKLIIYGELIEFTLEDFEVLTELQLGCKLDLKDSLLIFGSIVGKSDIFVTRDSDFSPNTQLKKFIKNSTNSKLKIMAPLEVLKIL